MRVEQAPLWQGFAAWPQLAKAKRVWVGYSGGLDSSVLLDLAVRWCRKRRIDVAALHIHHGLQPAADDFASHAQQVADQYKVPLTISRVQVEARRQGPAGDARAARYAAFGRTLRQDECLLLGHHAQDQLETLILQFLRGGGLTAQLGMPACRPLGEGTIVRPLLAVPRSQLHRYATSQGLGWIEDPSNDALGYARNWLRHQLLPLLEAQQPDLLQRLTAGARKRAEAVLLLQEVAEADLAILEQPAQQLDEAALCALSPLRKRQALYAWLSRHHCPLPSEAAFRALEQQLVTAKSCRFIWPGGLLRAYRQKLRLFKGTAPTPPAGVYEWAGGAGTLELPTGRLQFQSHSPSKGAPAAAAAAAAAAPAGQPVIASRWAPLMICFNRSDIRMRLHDHHASLKKIYQQFGVPDVSRPLLPLVFSGERLLAIADLCVAREARPQAGEASLRLHWQPANDYANLSGANPRVPPQREAANHKAYNHQT